MKSFAPFLLIFFLAGVPAHGQTDPVLISNVLMNLKKGYELKDVQILKTCFNPLPSLQEKAYVEMFKYMDGNKVRMEIKEMSISSNFARVEADIGQTYFIKVSGAAPAERTIDKSIHYILKKEGGKWFIKGLFDLSKVNKNIKISDKNTNMINDLLKTYVPDAARPGAFDSARLLSTTQNQCTWQVVPGAAKYVFSIADRDLTRETTGNLLWKIEGITTDRVSVPVAVINGLSTGVDYFAHIFAYDEKGNALSGQIYKLRKQ